MRYDDGGNPEWIEPVDYFSEYRSTEYERYYEPTSEDLKEWAATTTAPTLTVGQKVRYAPSTDAGCEVRVCEICTGCLTGMVVLRIWQGLRHVGDKCVSATEVETI